MRPRKSKVFPKRADRKMKEIFKEIRDAANDEKLSDADFRQVIRNTFAKRIHDETIIMSFLRAKDIAKARE